jgi:tRNA nucleotidyltransferase/poly(A) polymerase
MKIYLVGGAVRDELLGRPSKDTDYVVVGATVQELTDRFGRSVGESFPVFLDRATWSEYAMARREKKTGVGYHGFSVEFGPDVTLEEDLARRDLTINAMAKDLETGEIVDCFGGLDDLKNKLLRHTSAAFVEDPLRVVRLARFYARYTDFSVATETYELACKVIQSGEMDALPYERYWKELEKALSEKMPSEFFDIIYEYSGFEKIKFFNELFGDIDQNRVDEMQMIADAIKTIEPEDLRMTAFIALTARSDLDYDFPGLSYRIRVLHRNLREVSNLVLSSTRVLSVYNILKHAKAWGQGEEFNDLIKTMRLHETLFEMEYPVSAAELEHLGNETRKITSEPYQHLKGKAIGDAMERARLEVVGSKWGNWSF